MTSNDDSRCETPCSGTAVDDRSSGMDCPIDWQEYGAAPAGGVWTHYAEVSNGHAFRKANGEVVVYSQKEIDCDCECTCEQEQTRRRLQLWRISEATNYHLTPSQIDEQWTDEEIEEWCEYQKFREEEMKRENAVYVGDAEPPDETPQEKFADLLAERFGYIMGGRDGE